MSPDIIEVHREHLRSHRFIERYDSGFAYLRDELGFPESEISPGYREIEMEHMYRIHTDQQRPFLILQKNPNLKLDWVSGSLHSPHKHLSSWDGDSLARNIEHSRTTVSSYLQEGGALRLKLLLHSVADVFNEVDFSFESAIDQQEFEDYLRVDIGSDYSSDDESAPIPPGSGFFGEFAYTNAMKFQGPGNQVEFEQDDQKWLENEIAAIDPQVIFALGNDARDSIESLGFERTGYNGPFVNNEGKVYRYTGPNPQLEGMYAVRLYHLGARSRPPHEILHKSLRAIHSKL